MKKRLVPTILFTCLVACEEGARSPTGGASASASETVGLTVATIQEVYTTGSDEAMNIDSVSAHRGDDGRTWLFATAKSGDVIRIHDAASGEWLRDVGGTGDGAGEFRRPNGIVAIDGMLFVVERDNRRVQVLGLPSLEPLASFGREALIKPYGAYVQRVSESLYRLYVTDNYETADEQVPPAPELNRRVHVWSVEVGRAADGTASGVVADHVQAFGATAGEGTLRTVESIWGDPGFDRLMIAEEDPAGGRVVKVYTLDGHYADRLVGSGVFVEQPEGIALYECADGSGYWLTTDQQPNNSVFHLFDRRTLAHAGAFQGEATRNTDGIWLSRAPFEGFPAGALFAVHDDQAVAAFDWNTIADALALRTCPAD